MLPILSYTNKALREKAWYLKKGPFHWGGLLNLFDPFSGHVMVWPI